MQCVSQLSMPVSVVFCGAALHTRYKAIFRILRNFCRLADLRFRMFRYLAGLAFSLIPSFDIVSNQRLDEALLVFHAVQAFDDIRVILEVKPEVVLFPGALVVFCRVFRVIITHDYLTIYAISIAVAIAVMMITNIASGIRLFSFLVFVDYEHDSLRVALR